MHSREWGNDSHKSRWMHGKFHRIGGPANKGTAGSTAWYIEGKECHEYYYWQTVWNNYAIDTAAAWLEAYNAFRIL